MAELQEIESRQRVGNLFRIERPLEFGDVSAKRQPEALRIRGVDALSIGTLHRKLLSKGPIAETRTNDRNESSP